MDDKQTNKKIVKTLVYIFLGFFLVSAICLAAFNRTIRAFVVTLLVLAAYILLIKKLGYGKTEAAEIMEQAKKDNTIVVGKRVGKVISYRDKNHNNQDRYKATYEYNVNGQIYQYTCFIKGFYPDTEKTIYYKLGNPQKAVSGSYVKPGIGYIILCVVIPAIIGLIVFSLLYVDWDAFMAELIKNLQQQYNKPY